MRWFVNPFLECDITTTTVIQLLLRSAAVIKGLFPARYFRWILGLFLRLLTPGCVVLLRFRPLSTGLRTGGFNSAPVILVRVQSIFQYLHILLVPLRLFLNPMKPSDVINRVIGNLLINFVNFYTWPRISHFLFGFVGIYRAACKCTLDTCPPFSEGIL